VREVIDAVNALLIWGGKIRVISRHNGVLNPFNDLINEAKAGKNRSRSTSSRFRRRSKTASIRRVCLMKGWTVQRGSRAGMGSQNPGRLWHAACPDAAGAGRDRGRCAGCRHAAHHHRAGPSRCAGVRHFLPDTFKTAPKPLRDAMTANGSRRMSSRT
jgi:hypothetical protein